MRRALRALHPTVVAVACALATTSGVSLGLAAAPKKKKPAPKPAPTVLPAPAPTATPAPAPTPTVEPTPKSADEEPPSKPPRDKDKTDGDDDAAATAHVLLAVCPASTTVKDLEARALVRLLKKTCRALDGGTSAEPLSEADLLVAACVKGTTALDPSECGLHGALQVPKGDGALAALQLVADGELAMTVRTERVEKAGSPSNGTELTLAVEARGQDPVHATLLWHRSSEGYAGGRWLWFPLPMLTSDLSSSAQGYRLGVSPLAVAAGVKLYPSPSSRAYVGLSAFTAWNLLIPNDTQTLTNGTQVRLNYKALGGGVLIDGAGWAAIGLGLGHTFTTDARTDVRVWLYFGPRLLAALVGD